MYYKNIVLLNREFQPFIIVSHAPISDVNVLLFGFIL